jgi:hypothetical protein
MTARSWFGGSGLVALSLLTLGAPSAEADAIRCGRKLVSDGDTLYEVRARCGDPDQQIHRVELRTVRQWVGGPCIGNDPRQCGRYLERTIEVTIDELTYDFGPHQFINYLTFEQGRLISIVSGQRGVKQE